MMLSKVRQPLLYFSTLHLVGAINPLPPEDSHKCYFLDGTFDSAGGPCYGAVGASMCCHKGEDCVQGSALCLTGSYGRPGPYDNDSAIWRRSCTDITWQDPACLAIAYSVSVKSVQLSTCADGSFCPRTALDTNITCCNDNEGQFAIPGSAIIPESVANIFRAFPFSSSLAVASITSATSSSFVPPTVSQNTISTSDSLTLASSVASSTFSISSSLSPPTAFPNTISTSGSPTPSSAIAGSVSTNVPSPTPIYSPAPASIGLSQAANIGIGLGSAFGALPIALLIFIAFRLFKNHTSSRSFPTSPDDGEADWRSTVLSNESASILVQKRSELSGMTLPK